MERTSPPSHCFPDRVCIGRALVCCTLEVALQACFSKYRSPFLVAWSIRLLQLCSTPCLACSVTRCPDAPQTKPLAVERGPQGIRHKLRGDACPCAYEKVRGSASLPIFASRGTAHAVGGGVLSQRAYTKRYAIRSKPVLGKPARARARQPRCMRRCSAVL